MQIVGVKLTPGTAFVFEPIAAATDAVNVASSANAVAQSENARFEVMMIEPRS